MLEILPNFFKKHGIAPDEKVLVACSGGVDSTVLAHLFAKSGQPFALAHVNFGLRGANSVGDELFVKWLAEQFGVAFFSKKCDVKTEAERAKKGIQEIARELRYAFFDDVLKSENFAWIAAAHHLDDNLETLLLNLARGGAGLRGLRGMLPVRAEKRLIRPFLETKKAEIEAFATENGIGFRKDKSNDSDDYSRNFVRHHVLAPLRGASKTGLAGCAATFEKLRNADAFLNFQIEKAKAEIVRSTAFGFEISMARLIEKGICPNAAELFFEGFGFSKTQAEQIAGGQKGGRAISKDGKSELFFDVGFFQIDLLLLEKESFDWPADQAELHFSDGMIRRETFETTLDWLSKPINPPGVFLSRSLFSEPLRLRRWRFGDRFQPAGMHGQSKKLQDFFTDQKLSILEKRRVWILEKPATEEIVWIVGMRADHRFSNSEIEPSTYFELFPKTDITP